MIQTSEDFFSNHRGGFSHYHYNYICPSINDRNFPISGLEMYGADIALVHFNRIISSHEEVLEEISKLGFRPATILELLEYGEARPTIQRVAMVYALGSPWARKGSPHIKFPNLSLSLSQDRRVDLSTFYPEQLEYIWFAVAKRKI